MNIYKHSVKVVMVGAFVLLGATQSWAVPVSIDIQNGSGGGFGYSVVHSASGHTGGGFYASGTSLYRPLNGTLTGDLSTTGGFSLTNIKGKLVAPQGTLKFFGGSISDPGTGASEYASGTLNYTLTGGSADGNSGTFYFFARGFNGGPNNLNGSQFFLWGNNWNKDVMSRANFVSNGNTALGMDLKGTMQPVPEPSTMLLLGTGFLAIVGRRLRHRA